MRGQGGAGPTFSISGNAFSFAPPGFPGWGRIEGVTLSKERCQLVSTVTFLGGSLYLPNAHGEAGALVALDPPDENADGPIYFNEEVIPDRSWTESSADGGIVFINTEPGDYILSATKEGVVFEEVKLKCRAGVLANASPPHALQVIEYLEP